MSKLPFALSGTFKPPLPKPATKETAAEQIARIRGGK